MDTEGTTSGVFHPNLDWLLITHQGPLTFWALAQPRARVLTGHANKVNRILSTPTRTTSLSCGHDSVRLWPLGPGRGGVRRIASHHEGWCIDAAVSPDGERLALASNNGAWLAPSFDGEGRWLRAHAEPRAPG